MLVARLYSQYSTNYTVLSVQYSSNVAEVLVPSNQNINSVNQLLSTANQN